ncbi:RraA family protein [Tropicimonas sp. TH_r6]|uniref:RraA family protein n=1 Tax=Tropicimonas sp. TH_r6 TaxID=3082085 RepID=UPI0029546D27|nr:RraA family protein [Tropicimonas sp. TH_r6]MDV7143439.1 RraA family protein [Tropicimonas sp. TH_r6]
MEKFDYSDTDWDAIERLKKWYSGDVHDSMESLGLWGYLPGLSLFGALEPGAVVCGPAVTVLFGPSQRRGMPQDVYHNAIDCAPEGGIMVVEASCAAGSCTGGLMSTGAKTRGLVATIVNSTVRDIAEVREMGYPLFAAGLSPVGVTGKKEPRESQVPITIGGVTIRPGDVIFADIDGVLVIAKDKLLSVVEAAEALGKDEAACRDRLLAGEKLQSVWPAA